MKKLIFAFLVPSLLSATPLLGQTAIDVVESTFKISGAGEEVFYFGFSEGDQIVFNFIEVNGKELKELEIIELPTSSKFMDYKTKKIENKTIHVARTGIYQFRFSNSAISSRICRYKIQRIPANDISKNFNTNVYWRTTFDTTYSTVEEQFLVNSDTIISDVFSSTPQISSQNAINGNNNFQVIDFYLPDNSIAWSYYIGTGIEGKEEFDRARDNFTQNLSSVVAEIPGYGPMAALALTGISYFNKVQGEDNVKYWFLSDENSVQMFEKRQPFMQYKKGDVVNEASQILAPLRGKIYLALLNDNTIEPIKVTVRVTAISVNQRFETRVVQKMKISTRKMPF